MVNQSFKIIQWWMPRISLFIQKSRLNWRLAKSFGMTGVWTLDLEHGNRMLMRYDTWTNSATTARNYTSCFIIFDLPYIWGENISHTKSVITKMVSKKSTLFIMILKALCSHYFLSSIQQTLKWVKNYCNSRGRRVNKKVISCSIFFPDTVLVLCFWQTTDQTKQWS